MKTQHPPQPSVAIVGIGCIFAKSHDLKAFYHLLSRGISGITDPPDSHRHLRDYFDADPKKPDHIYCNRGGYLPPIKFDPTEFSIPPNVIEATDTSQLLGLVTAKKALEDAGYGDNGRTFDRNKASVILGVTGTQELVIPLGARLGHPIWRRALKDSGVPQDQADKVMARIADGYVSWQENSFPGLLGNVVAGRIANRLDLGGTNCVVDAACASSMGAIHMAMLELQSGRSDMVITGGVDTINDAFMHMCFSKTQILSASGDIRPFSKDADGTVLGEGVGLVVLKRMADAEKDGDRIYAVIKGLASSSDGRSQSIYAPRSDGQAKALRRAYAEAGIDPTTVSMVEAHGTGTRVGDQAEFNSLCDVFGATSPNGNRCALGSVKSNIGHTKAAAGTAGLIKAALSIYHKVLPPTLKADPVDPKLGVDHSPFYLNTRLRPWLNQQGDRRRAGVSAFGFGGSNFHAVLEEYSERKLEPAWDGAVEIAAFSGSDEAEVAAQIDAWRERVVEDPTTHQIGKASQQCRRQFRTGHAVRLVMVIDPYAGADHLTSICADAAKRLGGDEGDPAHRIYIGKGAPKGGVAFLFPGQGSQYVGMGRDLTCCFPESMAVLEEASRWLDAEETLDEYLFPRMPGSTEALESRLRQTRIAQPAIGAVSVAMMASLARFGVKPEATCGHSYGELVALHAAGWMGQEDLWRLSIERGRLMAEAGHTAGESGAMLAVQAPLKEIDQWIDESDCQVVLANRNSRKQGILSGTAAAIEAAEKACREKGWRSMRLPVAAAFHSPLVADARKPFRDCAASVQFSPGSIPVMSNTLGGAYPATAEEIPSILGKQLASSVDFVANIEALYGQGIRTFVEIGPKTVLTRLVGAILTDGDVSTVALDASSGRSSGIQDLATAISRLAALGHRVDLTQWEKPQAGKSKARMVIDLTGANVRNPRPHGKQIPKITPVKSSKIEPDRIKMSHSEAHTTASPKPAVPPAVFARPTSTSEQRNPEATAPIHRSNTNIQQALTAVQQGLESLQALQAQTVQAHQKFLDTQAAASQTLQQMIQGARQLAAGSFGGLAAGMDTAMDSGQKAARPVPERVSPAPPARPEPALAENKPEPVQKISSLAEGDRAANAGESTAGLEKALLDIVSRLTGYPEEMLGMEMDIESDLGIDSIKRVEILSALEEQMPDLPKVTPDLMGTLKTLGQIVDYLSIPPNDGATPVQADPSPAAGSPSGQAQQIQSVLIDIVSRLTGYPEEMLGLEMDIESDLGIDSIKRVEILSALEEQMPDLPKVTPDLMGTLKTLGQIVDYLCIPSAAGAAAVQADPSPAAASPSGQAQQIQSVLIDIVSQLTGYPEEMLGLEMDIESDLGIDSIKRVEILSALEEQMPDLPKVTPDLMGTLKTLGQIIDYLCIPSAGGAAAVQADPSPAAASPSGQAQQIQSVLIEIVSRLTGYPEEMLGLEMDIESDLGIDSIKRVEILSALEEQMPDLPKVTPDLMGTLKTLGQIIGYFNGPAPAAPSLPDTFAQADIRIVPDSEAKSVARHIIGTETLGDSGAPDVSLSKDHYIGVAGGEDGLKDELIHQLRARGLNARPLASRDDLKADSNLGGLVLLAPLEALDAFQWAQAAAPLLQQATPDSGAFLATVSFLDGAFGFSQGRIDDPLQGGLAGLVKTAAIEWPSVRCMALDVAPDWTDTAASTRAICDELLHVDEAGRREIGIGPAGRIGLKLTPVEAATGEALHLSPKDVVIITGGARGVTAAAAQALAAASPCTLVLMGRSPAPQPEPAWLKPLSDEGAIKKAILSNWDAGNSPTPKSVEKVYRRWMANREILNTLDQLGKTGADAHYVSVDVRDAEAVQMELSRIREKIGPIRGIIHGAGVLEDRLIVDKQAGQFDKVFATKVEGLQSLLSATADDALRHLVLFSSVTARMGNTGQADYAMANEVLNKTALQQASLRPDCKVIAINWGPWDGGMVTPSLRRNFRDQGISLIPLQAGARAMVDEMAQPIGEAVEVVIGGPLPQASPQHRLDIAKPSPAEALNLTCQRDVSVERYPVLDAHQLDGRPVVPLALITEWLAHSALHANPGLELHGMDRLRLLNGITLDGPGRKIHMLAGKAHRINDLFEVDVEIRDGEAENGHRIHSSAKAILSERLPAPPVFSENGHFQPGRPVGPIEEIYEQVLFHGRKLHGIQQIVRISDEGITARLATAPPPSNWIHEPLRSRWIADPLVLDSAFQMAIVWCHQQRGLVCLPSFAAAYRQYCRRFPKTGVSAVLEVRDCSTRKLAGDFTFLDAEKTVLAQLKGYEAIMDPGLIKAFKAA